jgi:hypothetical protein
MPNCPQCENLVTADALKCPHCGIILKAYGHQGIPLHQAERDSYLCDRCVYHEDDSCNFPQRPYAKTCTMYCDRDSFQEDIVPPLTGAKALRSWCRNNRGLLLLLGVILLSVLLVVLR